MPLSPGSHLGPYEVLALIGAGGMGEVYRARDPRLGREVAIKVLPHDRVSDNSRRQRFIQEAKAASALNHPHIVTIHEIESADGIDFLVMEYVRGKSVDALIPRQGMRLNEALRIAIAVADAVAAAHARGIVHRDLKPANVMVGTDGSVKVLDFGLAKLLSGHASPDVETVTHVAEAGLSAPGTIVGTAAYMSPEQAMGAAVDARSDIFSFGAMLYEMTTGVRAFAGKSTADTLALVLAARPTPPTTIVPALPRDLEKIILRCLRREPERRFQTMLDVKVELQEVKEESDSGSVAPPPRARRRRGVLAGLAAMGLLTAVAAGWLLWPRPHVDAPQKLVSLTSMTGHAMYPTFSPDGQQVAFAWQPEGQSDFDIYIKLVGLDDVRRLTADPANDTVPSWSPDGRQIAFVREGHQNSTIHLVSPIGGGERKLSDFGVRSPLPDPIAWSPDGRYVAAVGAERRGLFLIPATGGEPRLITPTGVTIGSFAFSPDGRRLAYQSCKTGGGNCPLSLSDLDTDFTPTGRPRPLTAQAPYMTWGMTWTHDGKSVVYGALDAGGESLWRVRVGEGSPPERVELAGGGAAWPAIATAGDRLAFARDLGAHAPYRFEPGRSSQPLMSSFFGGDLDFSADGQRIAYIAGDTNEVWTAKADGSAAQQLTHGPGRRQGSPHWSANGERIAFDSLDADGEWHIWSIPADGGVPRQVTTDDGSQNVPSWSQDGQWIYYSSSSDIWRIQLVDGRKQRLTSEGDNFLGAHESGDGRSLLYNHRGALMAMPLAGGPSRQIAPCVRGWAVASKSRGLYYAACSTESYWGGSNPALHMVNAETGEDHVLGTLEKFWSATVFGLAVSPDGSVIVYDRLLREGHDLMLIENFR